MSRVKRRKGKELYILYNQETKKSRVEISKDVLEELEKLKENNSNIQCTYITDYKKYKGNSNSITFLTETIEEELNNHFSEYIDPEGWFNLHYLNLMNYLIDKYKVPNKVHLFRTNTVNIL